MKTTFVESLGLTIPYLGFGTMRLPETDGRIDYARTAEMFDYALKNGVNYFDTAYMYHGGHSETCVGDLLSAYPRESYMLVDKLPLWYADTLKEAENIFAEQLRKCRTDYFDIYFVHSVDAGKLEKIRRLGIYDMLRRKVEQGYIRNIGFSFHDTPDVLKQALAGYEWKLVQLQINYIDWEIKFGREFYEIATSAGIPISVMEPVRGGALANLPPQTAKVFSDFDPSLSQVSWAFRFLMGLENVKCILSGMTSLEQLKENIEIFNTFGPLSEAESLVLQRAAEVQHSIKSVPCTACKYCDGCPSEVDIPGIFRVYNNYKKYKNYLEARGAYMSIPEENRARNCIECGQCSSVCPQHIDVPPIIKAFDDEMSRSRG